MLINKVLRAIFALSLIFTFSTSNEGSCRAVVETPRDYSSASTTGEIKVKSPNGREELAAGSIFYINWTWTGSFDKVRIEYTTDNGTTWSTITSSTDNDGSYRWNVPNTPSTLCKVRISDAADGSPSDKSDSVFTIKLDPTGKVITILSPNGGESLAVNTSYTITWTSTGTSGNVKIEYSTNGVTDWEPVHKESASVSNTGSYSWTVPDTPSTTCRVRISDAADSIVFDWSELVFSIVSGATAPTVTTNDITSISLDSAVCGGNVISDGGDPVTIRGVCWRTSPNPTKEDFKTEDGSGTDPFTSQITGLTPITTYYVRAYATNSMGTSYGAEKSFTTLAIYALDVLSNLTGVPITVSIEDNNGNKDGTTNFTRIYDANKEVRLDAPPQHDGKDFLRWELDDVEQEDGVLTITIPMNEDHKAKAVYKDDPVDAYPLNVKSTPITGVLITVSIKDNNGNKDGTTNFTRIYSAGRVVTLEAPRVHDGKDFLRWKLDNVEQDEKVRVITVTMNKSHTAQAVYRADTYTLTVQSSPEDGVPISVTPADNNNRGDGNTQFFRTYEYGTLVTLSAPGNHNGKNFVKWLIDGEPDTNPEINITMDSNHTAQAVYQSPSYTLSVQSSPDPGIEITVAPVDNNGEGDGTTDFTRTYTSGTTVTLTAPPSFEDSNFFKWNVDGKDITDRTIQLTMDGNRTAAAFYETPRPPEIAVNRTELNLGYLVGSSIQSTETIPVFNSGGGTLNWTVSTEFRYFELNPSSGTNCGEVVLTVVDADELNPGDYDGFIHVSAPLADNSPVEIKINLWVRSTADSGPPFGVFETPVDDSTVRSSIPVTGWALSDTGMKSVKIYREEGNRLVYIGDANFVENARSDVEAAFPGYPMNYKAGWGYMMLTNFLPGGGNGKFRIYAIATDMNNRIETLGIKTITVDNANAVKPFGAIDTPAQGGTASGAEFINWGWVLTPKTDSIPIDGSTINVYIDGVNLGHPTYNIYRSDIADLFPGYFNSDGAVGYFYLDTTAYDDGVHTIQWTATDSGGNTDGIGSRYFTIQNICGNAGNTAGTANRQSPFNNKDISNIPANYFEPVRVRKGFLRDSLAVPEILYPNDQGIITIKTRELEPLEVHFFDRDSIKPGQSILMISPPLAGSRIDPARGIFYWQPGPGFIGDYLLVFVEKGHDSEPVRKEIRVKILPKFGNPDRK